MNSRFQALLIAFALLLAIGACGSTPDAGPDQRGKIQLESTHPEAALAPGWMNVKTLQIHPATVQPEDDDLILEGTLVGWIFEPRGSVKGYRVGLEKPAGAEAAYLSLRDRRLIARDSGTIPEGPYLPGVYDRETELFYPDQGSFITPAPALPTMSEEGEEGAEEDLEGA